MEPFDLLGDLPTGATTVVLEASAGTGKTFTLAGLVTRYVAEGVATLDEMLLITFGRAASQELRERVRRALVEAARALEDPSMVGDNELLAHLVAGSEEELARRRHHLRDALASFDAATIATTHQFCQLVLRSLGVAGDTDAGVTLVESLDDLVTEVVDDLYLRRFGHQTDSPVLTRAQALGLAREVVANPQTVLTPRDPAEGSVEAVRVGFADDVLAELEPASGGSASSGTTTCSAGWPRAGGRRRAGPCADAPAVADRPGRRVPGHRPGPVEGDRAGVRAATRRSS